MKLWEVMNSCSLKIPKSFLVIYYQRWQSAHTHLHTRATLLSSQYTVLSLVEFMLPLRVFAIHNSWETWGGEQNRKTATPLSQSYVNLLGTIHFFQTHLYIWYNATHTWKRRYEKREKKGREEKGKKWRELVAYAVQGWS